LNCGHPTHTIHIYIYIYIYIYHRGDSNPGLYDKAPSNGLSVGDVHHYTKSSEPKHSSDLVLISGQPIQNTRIGVLDMKSICFSLIVVSRSNSDNIAYGWSVPERNNVILQRYCAYAIEGIRTLVSMTSQSSSNGLSVGDVHHYTKSSEPNNSSDLVLISAYIYSI
jgi:hypothetical protein